jgi:glucose/arabinose dehydrogenase
MRTRDIVPALALGLLVACGDRRPPAPVPSPPGSDTITGRERIGWTQQATDGVEVSTFSFAMYVDGARRVLTGVACGQSSAAGFDCSAALPPLTPGSHTLELASFITSGADVLESARSAPLQVTVAAVVSAQEAEAHAEEGVTTGDGTRLRLDVVARGLDDPTDMAFAPDGRGFVAERAGLVRVLDGGRLLEPAAVRLRDVSTRGGGGLLAIALHPEYSRNHFIYLVYTAEQADATVLFRLLRLRESGGALAEVAVLAEEPGPQVDAAAVARFGPDGKLYLAYGDGGDPRRAQDLSSALGKVLRLDDDGSTPDDNMRLSPVLSMGHREPRGLAWHPETGALWEAERGVDGDEINVIVAGGNYGWPFARGREAYPGTIPSEVTLPAGTGVSGACVYDHRLMPSLRGDLLIAARNGQDLLRVRLAGGRRASGAERLLDGRFGRIGQVAQGPDGALYLSTANRDVWGEHQDLVVRLAPASR